MGSLGKKILQATKHEDVEILGFKVRVRPMNALQMFSLRGMADVKNPEEALAQVFAQDKEFLTKLIADSCFDPENGEKAFDLADAALLPGDVFVKLLNTVMDLSKPPKAEEAKN